MTKCDAASLEVRHVSRNTRLVGEARDERDSARYVHPSRSHFDGLVALSRLTRLSTPLASAAAGSTLVRGVATALNLVVSILVARLAGPQHFGVYVYCMAVVTLLVQPLGYGFATTVVRHVATYRAREEWGRLRGGLRRAVQVIAVSVAILVAIGLLMGLASVRIAPDSRVAFFLALGLIPLVAVNIFRSAVLRGLSHVVRGQMPELVVPPAVFLLLIGVAATAGVRLEAVSLVMLQLAATAIAVVLGGTVLRRRLPAALARAEAAYEDRTWLTGLVPLLLVGGFMHLGTELAVVLLGQTRGPEAAGIFRLAARGAELVSFTLLAIGAATGPAFAHLFALGDRARLIRLAARSTQGALLVALPVALGLILLGDRILGLLYGPAFVAGAVPLAVLAAGHLVNVAAGPVALLLTMTGHERDSAVGTLVGLVASVALTVLLIPSWGATGAAAAVATGFVLRAVLHSWLVFRRLAISPIAMAVSRKPRSPAPDDPVRVVTDPTETPGPQA